MYSYLVRLTGESFNYRYHYLRCLLQPFAPIFHTPTKQLFCRINLLFGVNWLIRVNLRLDRNFARSFRYVSVHCAPHLVVQSVAPVNVGTSWSIDRYLQVKFICLFCAKCRKTELMTIRNWVHKFFCLRAIYMLHFEILKISWQFGNIQDPLLNLSWNFYYYCYYFFLLF